jgi:hypothetical protein
MFHIALVIFFIISSIRWGNWNRWREFLPTVYYFSFFNLFYQYISFSFDKKLWELKKPIINLFFTDALYAFIAYPCFIIWFLSNEVEGFKNKVLRYSRWVIISVLIEFAFYKLGYIGFENGWNLYYELLFYPILYTFVSLHHRKPFLTIVLSLFVSAFLLYIFEYPVFKGQ